MQNSILHKGWFVYGLSVIGMVLLLLSSTKWATQGGTNPYVWLLAGMFFVFPAFYLTVGTFEPSQDNRNRLTSYSWLIALLLLCVGAYIGFRELSWLFDSTSHLANGSDVIPSLKVYVERLLNGDKVYVAIPFENYSVLPTYFPAMWMPYLIPETLGFDYRWMAIGSFYILYSGVSIYYLKRFPSLIHALLVALFPLLMILWFVHYDSSSFIFATELMPLCFYILLVLGLTQKRLWLIGVAIALCTMSRYSYTLWILPFVVIIWREWGFQKILKIGLIGTAVILVMYVIPFLLQDPTIFTDGLAYYGRTAADQWKEQAWQEDGAIPFHLNNGLSFSYHIYTSVTGSPIEKLDVAKILNLIVSFIAALSIIFLRGKSKNKIKWNDYLAVSLFLYLLFFYSFLYVPFSYLFMLPLGLGMTIFSIYGSRAIKV